MPPTAERRPAPPVVLTIGGSDSAGRCGVQADLLTFEALGAHGATALTVVTAQDTLAVRAAWPLPVEAVIAQVVAILGDLPVGAVKTGMLGRTDVVEAIADLADGGRLPNLVVDTVLVDGAGASLFPPAVTDAYRHVLLPKATAVAVNRDELALLVDRPVASVDDLEAGAHRLWSMLGGPAVLATGGRLAGHDEDSVDVLVEGGLITRLSAPRIATANVAGTGDSLSAALATGLALGQSTLVAAQVAKRYVTRAAASAAHWQLGAGRGPIDHKA